IAIVLVAGVAGATAAWQLSNTDNRAADLQTAPLNRGDLVAGIAATGTVEPEEVVDVGAQVGGQISAFGTDEKGNPIDYGSAVEAGTVLARIDDSVYAADVQAAKAQLEQARANQLGSEAAVQQAQAKLTQAQQEWQRAQELRSAGILAQS